MKKAFRIRIIIITILVVGLIAVGIFFKIRNSKRTYEIAQVKEYNYFLLKKGNSFGVIDKKGNEIIASQFDEIKIPNPEKAIFICSKNGEVKVLNDKQEEILTQFKKIDAIKLKNVSGDLVYEKSVLKYQEKEKYGLINFEGKKITNAIYDEIENLPYKEGELLVKKNGKSGIINIRGGKIIDFNYDKIDIDKYYSEGNKYKYAGYIITNKTEEGYRYGYINYKGELIEEVQYNELSRITDIEDIENEYLIVAEKGQYGIKKNGKKILESEYQSINYDEKNKLFVIEKSKKFGISDINGKIIIPLEYNQIDINGIYLYAENEQGITVYNSEGSQVNIDTNIALINTENENYRIRINSTNTTKYGIIGKDGKKLVDEKYNYIEYLYDNYFIVSKENSKLGVIDDKDSEKIEVKYDSIQKIQNTNLIQTSISQTNTTQLFSKEMKKICDMKDAIVDIYDNYIEIYNETEIRYFDKNGNELKNTEVYPNNKMYLKQENGKYGFVDINNKLVVDYKYDYATEFNEFGFASVKKDGKWGAIDEQGNEIVSPNYEFNGNFIPFFIGRYYKITYGFGEVYFTDNH